MQLNTSMGPIVIELDEEGAPVTCANFVEYVKAGFYDGICFHRAVPGFVVQSGAFGTDLVQKPARDPIKSEWKGSVKNTRGTVAMNRLSNRPDSATSQFFINVADNAGFDSARDGAGYTVFGRVIEGMDVVDSMSKVPTATTKGMRDVPVQPVVIERATWSPARPAPGSQPSSGAVAAQSPAGIAGFPAPGAGTGVVSSKTDSALVDKGDPTKWRPTGLVLSEVDTADNIAGVAKTYRVETTENPSANAPRFLRGPEEVGVAGPYPVCVIARAGDLRFIQVCLYWGAGNFVNFDLESGTVTRSGSQVAATQSVALGGGWYRLEATFTVPGNVTGTTDGMGRLFAVDHGDVGFHPRDTTVTGHFFLASPKLEAVVNTEGSGAPSVPVPSNEKTEPKS